MEKTKQRFQLLGDWLSASFKMFNQVSVTRLGDLLDFGPLFKAFSNNEFAQISHFLRQFL